MSPASPRPLVLATADMLPFGKLSNVFVRGLSSLRTSCSHFQRFGSVVLQTAKGDRKDNGLVLEASLADFG